MTSNHRFYLSQKNSVNNNQQNKKEIKSYNYLKQNEKFPHIQKNNDSQTKYSNYTNNQAKLSSNFNNHFLYCSQSNNDSKINNFNRNLEKEGNKNIYSRKKTEQTTKIKEDETFNLKSENFLLKRKLDDIETQFFTFKGETAKELNELKQSNSKIENRIISKNDEMIKNLDNKINSLNENIKNLKKKIEEKDILFEDYKIKNKSITENIENSLNKILSEIESLKTQNNNSNQNKTKYENGLEDKNKNELMILKREKELSKVELEKLNSKHNELDLINKELIKKNEELKNQNNVFKKINKELNFQNEELKNKNGELKEQSEKIAQQNKEITIQNEKLIEKNKELIKQNEELQKLNEGIKKKNKELIKQNEELKLKKGESKDKIQDENKTKKYYDKKYAIRGLNNIGNNCYMNSVLQILKNIPQFSYNIINLNDNGDNFLIQLKNLFFNLCSSDDSAVSPKEFKKYLGLEKLGKMFAGNNQYDSSIFYVSLLNIIDKKLNIEKIKKIDMTQYKDKTLEERLAIYKKNDYNFKKETFIFDTFYIYFANEIKCKSCKNIIHVFQKLNFLDFPIVNLNGYVKSLEECFENYQKIKDVKDTCSKCNNFGITHKFIFLKLPPVLIINLKRVGEQTVYFNEIQIPNKLNMEKIIKNSINFSNSIYELRGFIKHDGDEKSGHNFAFCKNMFDDKWYEYNDSICRKINDELNLNKIFFLCYIKLGSDFENFDIVEKIVEALNSKNKND